MSRTSNPLISRVLIIACCLSVTGGCALAPDKAADKSAPAEVAPLPEPYRIALELMAEQDYAAAAIQLERFCAKHPEFAGPYVNMAIALWHTDKAEESMAATEAALKANPDFAPAHHHLALLLRERGEFQAAEAAYLQSLRLDGDYALAHRNLGILYDLYLTKPETALKHYSRYLSLSTAEDVEVKRWVADLERRVETGKEVRN